MNSDWLIAASTVQAWHRAGLLPPWWWYGAGVFLAQFGLFLRWLHRRMRDEEIQRAFVRDLALNHLPHIYGALRQLAEHHGVELEEPPLVRYVEINGENTKIWFPGPKR